MGIPYFSSRDQLVEIIIMIQKHCQICCKLLYVIICDTILENHPFGHNGQFSVLQLK